MTDLRKFPLTRCEAVSLERRSGVDRRSGRDRRTVDLWLESGRPGFELRSRVDRRSGDDRRQGIRRDHPTFVEIVTPWQIPEPRPADQRKEMSVTAETSTVTRLVNLLGW